MTASIIKFIFGDTVVIFSKTPAGRILVEIFYFVKKKHLERILNEVSAGGSEILRIDFTY